MRYVTTVFLFFISTILYAADPIVTVTRHHYENIGKYVSVLEDTGNSFSIGKVLDMDRAGKFASSGQSILNFGNSRSAFWIKIKYRHTLPEAAYLVIDVPNIDHIDFYSAAGPGRMAHQHSGSLSTSSLTVSATNHYIFDLQPSGPGSQSKVVYLKVQSNNIMLLALKLADAKTLITSASQRTGFEAVYSGILIMLFILNVFLFISIRDKSYLYYTIYLAGLFVYLILYLRGYSYLFGLDFRRFVNLYPHIFVSISSISIYLFSLEFLGVKQRIPRMVLGHQIMIGAWLILLVAAIFLGKSAVAVAVNYLIILSCIVAWYFGLLAYRSGLRSAFYYLIAWFAVGFGLIITMLGVANIIPYSDISYEIGPICTTIEMLFLSFALGDRYKQIRREKLRVEKENFNLIISQNERLESVVEERTRKLVKSNAEKDKLFSIVAHDLRSPFNSLVSILELNNNGLLNFEELKMLLVENKKNIDQIRLTLDNLLYWARGQMDRPGANPENTDLQDLVEKMILVYQPLSVAKGVTLSLNCSEPCRVFADADQINLVLRNLIDNAIKFSPPESTVQVTLEAQSDKVEVSVRNAVQENGTANLAHLLDSGQFLSTPGTNNERGVGLGLHLCREYIRLNKGELKTYLDGQQVIISFSLPIANK